MQYELQYIQAFAAVAVVQYLVWAAVIILSFTRHLKIKAFSIPPPPKATKAT